MRRETKKLLVHTCPFISISRSDNDVDCNVNFSSWRLPLILSFCSKSWCEKAWHAQRNKKSAFATYLTTNRPVVPPTKSVPRNFSLRQLPSVYLPTYLPTYLSTYLSTYATIPIPRLFTSTTQVAANSDRDVRITPVTFDPIRHGVCLRRRVVCSLCHANSAGRHTASEMQQHGRRVCIVRLACLGSSHCPGRAGQPDQAARSAGH
ncbi:hypothetical protein IWX49DRAFT_315757 [Phyllosticta citricarpa]